MIKLYGRKSSDSVQKAHWLLAETKQPYELIELGGQFGGLQEPYYLELNPHGRIPTLCDEGVTVWESNAIIRYLSAKYMSGSIWPDDVDIRSYADQWMEWGQTTLYPNFNNLFWMTIRTPSHCQNKDEIQKLNATLNDHYRIIEQQLGKHENLTGNSLSIADFPIGATLYRYFNMPIVRPELPNIEAWYQRLIQRDAYKKAIMVPFEELRGKLSY